MSRTFFRIPLAAATLAAAIGGAQAEPVAQVTEFGLFTRGTESVRSEPQSPSGIGRPTTGQRLVQKTNQVPLVIGTKFGFCFTVDGIAPDGPVVLTKLVEHPPLLRADGSSSSSFTTQRNLRVINGHLEGCEGYSFDHEYELVPGTWKFSLSLAGKPVLSQEFEAKLR